MKLGIGTRIIFGADRLYQRHPRLAMATLGAINTGYVLLVQRSYRNFPGR